MKNKFLLASLFTMFSLPFLSNCTVDPRFYTIYLDVNGGALDNDDSDDYLLSPSSPKKTWKSISSRVKVSRLNYTFSGWLYKGKAIEDDYVINSDMLVVASWVEIQE